MTRFQSRFSMATWGAAGIIVLVVLIYVVFGGRAGLSSKPFILHGVFASDAGLTIDSPVRIAGINVGKVSAVDSLTSGQGAAAVTMEITPKGLPIHKDAVAKIRTRLFLEGNFYVELSPGTPSQPDIKDGATLGLDRTSGPVQFDRILTSLPMDSRMSLRTVVQGLGQALGKDGGTDGVKEDPSTVGQTAGQSLNDSLADAPEALLGSAKATEGLLGLTEHDFSEGLKGQAKIQAAFASRENELTDLIDNFDTTMAAFASEQDNLRATIRALPPLLQHSDAAFDALNSSFPPTRLFARALTPSIKELPSTIDAALPWIHQTRLLVSEPELGGLAKDARPATINSAKALGATEPLVKQLTLLARCTSDDLIPTGDKTILDPPLSTGNTVYSEFFQSFTGVASSLQNFDGNGVYGRTQTGGGDIPVATGDFHGQGPMRGNTTRAPLGSRPKFPNAVPPVKTDQTCYKQKRPDLNAATGVGP